LELSSYNNDALIRRGDGIDLGLENVQGAALQTETGAWQTQKKDLAANEREMRE